MNRRQALLAVAAWPLGMALPAHADSYSASPGLVSSPTGVVLVELANFRCPRCRSVNDHADRIREAARSVGIAFHFAPVAWDKQSLWPDRVYYATRDLYPAAESAVRFALFDGIHRDGMIFETLPQVLAYFERRQLLTQATALDPKFNIASIAQRAEADITMISEAKAGRLVNLSGASEVPIFAWVRNGEIIKVRSPADAPEPINLVNRVIADLTATATSGAQ